MNPPDPTPAAPDAGRYLVTGAGSGIGRAVVQLLRAQGHRVWAGARQARELEALHALGAEAVALDVCDAASVRDVAQRVAAAPGGALHGLVLSAGVGALGPLAGWRDDELLALLDVNVVGVHRVVNALLDALVAGGGRIVVVGSMGGSITQAAYGPYTMSKHALEAYAACLREELAPHGVAVSIVQPGAVATPIGAKARAANLARLAATPPPFDAAARALAARLEHPPPPRPDEPESADNRRAAPPEAVAQVIVELLHADDPPLRRLVGTRWEGDRVLDALIERLLDADDNPSHRLGLDALQQRLAHAAA